ncbi:MAG: hypothetical protein A3D56_01370 [Candidatus Taylorbacteria bacterium RIFCSPHIGHO2_02_FULL_45_35]|uniref:Uncharacterized protein n=1 Tax=Candidatus Taylorbacteria bacterium RIFCSPHIGHO2_02_FULL_45_35 TaxID=1802311 RepID=A0A1G2MXD2_9BACT|nr:MAG: hypothetical protein A3D56_01370 [Candidatus Taylorbacteria bacterium RIFCSPHIGHO2_02_FULL_45_35]
MNIFFITSPPTFSYPGKDSFPHYKLLQLRKLSCSLHYLTRRSFKSVEVRPPQKTSTKILSQPRLTRKGMVKKDITLDSRNYHTLFFRNRNSFLFLKRNLVGENMHSYEVLVNPPCPALDKIGVGLFLFLTLKPLSENFLL